MTDLERSKIEFVATSKWEEVKTALRTACGSFGGFELRILEESGEEFIIERVKDGWVPKRLRLHYDYQCSKIGWHCCDPTEHTGEISFRVFGDSVLYVVNGKNRPLSEIIMVLTSCVTGKA